jgi:hypothetical protein
MRKTVALSIAALSAISTLNAAENLSSMLTEGKASGQLRAFYIDRHYDPGTHRSAAALGGHVKYETGDLYGLSLGMAAYTTNRVFRGLEIDSVDPTLFGAGGTSDTTIGEAYLQYSAGNTTLKLGRQKIDTPLAGSDDARMLPNFFEAYLAINKDIPDTTIIAGHVTKFAAGSFSNAYNGGDLGVTAGYTAIADNTARYQGEFANMGTWAVGEKTEGVSVVSGTYTGVKNLKVQVWDYYAWDILNAVYAQADFSWKCLITDMIKPSASVQLIKENDVGDALVVGSVDAMYWGAKLNAKVGSTNVSLAYSQTGSDTSTFGNGEILSPWGGMPAFTQGMVTRHQFLADTDAFKVAVSHDWKDMGINLKTVAYYAYFDVGSDALYATDTTTREPGFDIQYYPEAVKNLQLRFRGNFPSDFSATGTDWDEYRFIVNYNF